MPCAELQRSIPTASLATQISSVPGQKASDKNIVFIFFLADELQGAIAKPLESCKTISSFSEQALAAWRALSEEQHQPRMIVVRVITQGVGLPIAVLWDNKESFERMMDIVLEQAAGKQTILNVEVLCFKRE